MKILIVSPAPPNMYHRIRLHHLIKVLAKDHVLHGVFLTEKLTNSSSIKINADYFSKSKFSSILSCLNPLAVKYPYEVTYCKNTSINKYILEHAAKYDIVLVKRLRAIQFIPKELKTSVVIDSTDAMSLYYRQASMSVPLVKKPLFIHEALAYKKYEKDISKKFNNWVVCSKGDAFYLNNKFANDAKIFVVPNVVDMDYYISTRRPLPKQILFSGLMNKFVNQNAAYFFLEKIYPFIIAKIPNIKLDIVGPNPPKKLLSYQDSSIQVHGKVSDIRKYIDKASVVVVPVLVGTGTRNKILQAWSQKRPVISTRIGASGLKGIDKKHLLIADNPKIFANSVIKLMEDKRLVKRLVTNAYRLVEKEYDIEKMRGEYNKVLNKVVNGKQN